MPGIHDLGLFVVAGLMLNVTPGQDTLYIVARSAALGERAGMVAALGIGAGCLVHVVAATAGISAVLATSATAFTMVKLVGAGYLVYVGITMLRGRKARDVISSLPPTHRADADRAAVSLPAPTSPAAAAPPTVSTALPAIFWQGCLTNVLNPKVALFFLAFLPQFVAADAPRAWAAFLFLGLLFDLNGTLWNLFVAWSAARVSRGLSRARPIGAWLERGIGAFFVYLGVRLALVDRS